MNDATIARVTGAFGVANRVPADEPCALPVAAPWHVALVIGGVLTVGVF